MRKIESLLYRGEEGEGGRRWMCSNTRLFLYPNEMDVLTFRIKC